jgi:hypothetical protein
MANINLMTAVNVKGIAAQPVTVFGTSTNLQIVNKNLHMPDVTCYLGIATIRGGVSEIWNKLSTRCKRGDIFSWHVYPVNPYDNITILGITGQATTEGGPVFQRIGSHPNDNGGVYYSCVINQGASSGIFHYNIRIEISVQNEINRITQNLVSSVEID